MVTLTRTIITIMKRVFFLLPALAIAASLAVTVPASATGETASGTLGVTATVQSSISLVFDSDASGVTLGGSGTNAATLGFGNVYATGLGCATNVTCTPGASTFTVSTPFDVKVSKFNLTSSNYTLTAQLNAADASNTWKVGGNTVTSGSAATLTSTGAYASDVPYTLALTISNTAASGTAISNTVNFTATAN